MTNTILVTDIGGDIDDVLALYTAIGSSKINLIGILVTGNNNFRRAHLTKQLLAATSYRNISVISPPDKQNFTSSHKFSMPVEFESGDIQEESDDAVKYLNEMINKHHKDIVIACIGPLTTVAEAVMSNSKLLSGLTRFYIQGQSIVRDNKHLDPDVVSSYNLREDEEAATIVFQNLQENNINITCLGKFAAYRVLLEKKYFANWSHHFDLVNYATQSIKTFWEGNPEKVYEIYQVPKEFRSKEKYLEYLKFLSSPYDPLLILCITDPYLFESISVGGHQIIGSDVTNHGVPNPEVVKQKIDNYIANALMQTIK
ncbi:hypothetical protein AKO1_002425 [Acrasis kona]|uniref:Inosine/uridine-preferring nucleoside hydrolase domain-containing protein n=1 Tax=Acrasis kona TaxID=1008807 RepID=A0AAW2ZPQ9_9EUKA